MLDQSLESMYDSSQEPLGMDISSCGTLWTPPQFVVDSRLPFATF